MDDQQLNCTNNMNTKQDSVKPQLNKDGGPGNDLWNNGIIYAFEFVRGSRVTNIDASTNKKVQPMQKRDAFNAKKHTSRRSFGGLLDSEAPFDLNNKDASVEAVNGLSPVDSNKETVKHDDTHFQDSRWVPIGWDRINELVQMVQADINWASQQIDLIEDEEDFTVAGVAAPYWERPAGPTWWCHVDPSNQFIQSWLSNAHWLHPAISIALRDESRLISERMKYLLYEVPVRVAGGLLFELLGQSVGDPFCDEDDIPVVIRSWQAQNFLITALHMKGSASCINVIGIQEVQELLLAGGHAAARTVHEVIAHLARRLSRWDDRLFRKFVFGAADEIELKFVNRRNHEDLNLLSIILNQEIRKLATQVIRVKWSLHAREEIVFELLHHLRTVNARSMLEGIKKSTREMLEEQEAVRGRLFTIQDVLASTVRAWLQDKSLRVTHNLGIFGGCGLVLSIITGLFGINVDGIPGAENTPYAFALFSGLLFLLGLVLILLGMLYLGLKKPVTEEQVNVRKLELQQLISTFQHDAETHAKVRQDGVARTNLPPTSADMLSDSDPGYVLIA